MTLFSRLISSCLSCKPIFICEKSLKRFGSQLTTEIIRNWFLFWQRNEICKKVHLKTLWRATSIKTASLSEQSIGTLFVSANWLETFYIRFRYLLRLAPVIGFNQKGSIIVANKFCHFGKNRQYTYFGVFRYILLFCFFGEGSFMDKQGFWLYFANSVYKYVNMGI